MWHIQERHEVLIRFWWGNLRERDKSEKKCLYEKIILKLTLKTLN